MKLFISISLLVLLSSCALLSNRQSEIKDCIIDMSKHGIEGDRAFKYCTEIYRTLHQQYIDE